MSKNSHQKYNPTKQRDDHRHQINTNDQHRQVKKTEIKQGWNQKNNDPKSLQERKVRQRENQEAQVVRPIHEKDILQAANPESEKPSRKPRKKRLTQAQKRQARADEFTKSNKELTKHKDKKAEAERSGEIFIVEEVKTPNPVIAAHPRLPRNKVRLIRPKKIKYLIDWRLNFSFNYILGLLKINFGEVKITGGQLTLFLVLLSIPGALTNQMPSVRSNPDSNNRDDYKNTPGQADSHAVEKTRDAAVAQGQHPQYAKQVATKQVNQNSLGNAAYVPPQAKSHIEYVKRDANRVDIITPRAKSSEDVSQIFLGELTSEQIDVLIKTHVIDDIIANNEFDAKNPESFGNFLHQMVVHKNNLALQKIIPLARHLLNERNAADGKTPLHVAVVTGNSVAAKILIDAGADLLIKDDQGKTAADYAVANNEIAQLILEKEKPTTQELREKTAKIKDLQRLASQEYEKIQASLGVRENLQTVRNVLQRLKRAKELLVRVQELSNMHSHQETQKMLSKANLEVELQIERAQKAANGTLAMLELAEKAQNEKRVENYSAFGNTQGFKEITPTYHSKSLSGAEISIEYSDNNLELRRMQYNLVIACDNLALDQIQSIVNRGVKVPLINYKGKPVSLLNFFASSESDQGVKAAEILLSQEGVSPEGASSEDFPLGVAAAWGNAKLMRLLLAKKADPYGRMANNLGASSGKNILELAFDSGKEEAIKVLLLENNLFPLDKLTTDQLDYLYEKNILNPEIQRLFDEKENRIFSKLQDLYAEVLKIDAIYKKEKENFISVSEVEEKLRSGHILQEKLNAVGKMLDEVIVLIKKIKVKKYHEIFSNDEQKTRQSLVQRQAELKAALIVLQSQAETNKNEKQSEKPFAGDFLNAQGHPVDRNVGLLVAPYELLESDSLRVNKIAPAKHLSECAGLTERPAANGIKDQIDILCIRLRKGMVHNVSQKLDNSLLNPSSGDFELLIELLDAYPIAARKEKADQLEKFIKENMPHRLEEFREIKAYHCDEINHSLRNLPHRLDYLATTSRIVIPNFDVDYQAMTIRFSYRDTYLKALQRDLVHGVLSRKADVVKRIAQLGVEFPDIKDQKEQKPKSILNLPTTPEVLKIVLDYGVRVEGITGNENDSPLIAGDHEYNRVKLLVDAGADLLREITVGGRPVNLLSVVFASRETDVLKFLLEKKFPINDKKSGVLPALLYSRGKLTPAQFDCLMEAKFDIAQEESGQNILQIAAAYAYDDALQAILPHAVKLKLIDKPNSNGLTPLQTVIGYYGQRDKRFEPESLLSEEMQRLNAVRRLVAAGADLFATGPVGTAKDFAEKQNLNEIAAFLDREMQKNPRYPEYLAKMNSSNNWVYGLAAILFIFSFVVTIIRGVLSRLWRAEDREREAAVRAKAAEDVRSQGQELERVRAAEAEVRVKAERERKAKEQAREKRQEERGAAQKAEMLADLQLKFSKIKEEKNIFDEHIKGFRERKSNFNRKEDKTKEMFPQGLMVHVNEKKAKSQGEVCKLANKINDKKHEIDADIKGFDDLLQYHEKKTVYDEKIKACEKELTQQNLATLKAALSDLEEIASSLKDLEKNINNRKAQAEGLIKEFETECNREPVRPAAASDEKRHRYDPKAEKEQQQPKDPSSSTSKSKQQEEQNKATPSEVFVGPVVQQELRKRKKPAAAGAQQTERFEKPDQPKPVALPQSVSTTLAVSFLPPPLVKQPPRATSIVSAFGAEINRPTTIDVPDIDSHEPVTTDSQTLQP